MGQMPFLVTPEGKVLGQSGSIMKYICKQGGTVRIIKFVMISSPAKTVSSEHSNKKGKNKGIKKNWGELVAWQPLEHVSKLLLSSC